MTLCHFERREKSFLSTYEVNQERGVNHAQRKTAHRRRSLLRNPRPRRAADFCAFDGLFRRSVEAMADAAGDSLQLIFHDPRGCGRSVPTQSVYTIEQMALDIVAMMDHLKLPAAHLIGHSMGGRIALSLAQNFPGKVKSLIMAASGSGTGGRGRARIVFPVCRIAWSTTWSRWVSRNSFTTRSSSRTLFSPKIIATQHRDKVEEFFKARLGDPCQARSVHSSLHRAP